VSVHVLTVAGRRFDAPQARVKRFPAECIETVRGRLRDRISVLTRQGVRALVASAKCGVDLLALEEADGLGLRLCAVLPFDPARFRAMSVVDRPGDWGPLFDRLVAKVDHRGDLVVLAATAGHDAAYAAANQAILQEAVAITHNATGLPRPDLVTALVVWDGASRGARDVTAAFRDAAFAMGCRAEDVPTC
jgi:hypothetical protein